MKSYPITLRESNMAMEIPPFEDVFPIENGDFPLLCQFTGGYTGILSQSIGSGSRIPETTRMTLRRFGFVAVSFFDAPKMVCW